MAEKTSDRKTLFLDIIAQTIFDKKGFNILALDVHHISTMSDYCIIAEGTVERHVKSLYNAIVGVCEKLSIPVYHAEGQSVGDWIVIDCAEVVVHLMTPDLREKYALEDLWRKAKIVDVAIDVKKRPLVE